jgi:hypothetical protein
VGEPIRLLEDDADAAIDSDDAGERLAQCEVIESGVEIRQ